MGTRYRRIAALLLAVLLLLCTACGTVPAQPEDTGDKDQYMTDPVPEGKPAPVEPQDVVRDDDAELTCTFSISCATILDNWDKCDDSKKPLVPADGVILPSTTVTFSEGESVFDVLQRVCRDNKIHMESVWTPMYNSAYVETVVLLSKGEVDSRKIRVEFSLEDMDMSEFQDGATYPQIKEYVLEHTGLKVSNLYISQIKRKCGIEVGKNYNLPKSEDSRQPQCPPEKEKAIREAFKYFGMI